ncbi:hypothetical protein DPMN_028990 [Dreissena polymorpha]|uniref:Uncharacterized protein n=1 Tax=Dreissena polymorpha TaxID=45954 RepID=A0A9D4LVN7_DREPO|nr:hypothetical protein DPMN_028990 [Dreissena polymorpha]
MQANPGKFQAIAVGEKTISRSPIFDLDGFSISCDEVVKLLGVDIDCKLKFDSHVPAVRTTSYGKTPSSTLRRCFGTHSQITSEPAPALVSLRP